MPYRSQNQVATRVCGQDHMRANTNFPINFHIYSQYDIVIALMVTYDIGMVDQAQANLTVAWNRYSPQEQVLFATTYQSNIAHAGTLAGDFDGKQASYEVLMETLSTLEQWLQGIFRPQLQQRLKTDEELVAAQLLGLKKGLSIDDLLDTAAKSFRAKVLDALKGEARFMALGKKLGVLAVQTDEILLPPGAGAIQQRSPNREDVDTEKIEVRMEQRLAEVIILLQDNGIYTDDIVVVSGNVRTDMVRAETYALVEIPRLRRQVLVCDEVGEATFVIQGMFDRKMLQMLTKEELQEKYPEQVRRIVRKNPEQWSRDLLEALFTTKVQTKDGHKEIKSNPIGEKYDLQELERVRAAIFAKYPTSMDWMKVCDDTGLIVLGYGVTKLGTIFHIPDNVRLRKKDLIVLGIAIYGDGDLFLQSELEHALFCDRLIQGDVSALEQLRVRITKVCPNGETWMPLFRQSGDITPGFGQKRLATIFGIAGDPLGQKKAFVKLGMSILGENCEILRKELEAITFDERLDQGDVEALEELRNRIKAKHPNGEVWMTLGASQSGTTIILGYGIDRLKKLFNEPGDVHLRKNFISLGVAIYGTVDLALQKELARIRFDERIDQYDPEAIEELRQCIKQRHHNGEAWMELFTKNGDVTPGFGKKRLATIFGIVGDPNTQKKAFVALGSAVFGGNDKKLQDELETIQLNERLVLGSPEEIKRLVNDIKSVYPDGNTWMTLWKKSGDIVSGYKIRKIGLTFKVADNPLNHRKAFVALGIAIYGDADQRLQQEQARLLFDERIAQDQPEALEELRNKIKETLPNGSVWLNRFATVGEVVPGYGFVRLGKVFKVDGNPKNQKMPFIQLGRAIYGPDDPILKKLSEQDSN